jgi:hypothetical protein
MEAVKEFPIYYLKRYQKFTAILTVEMESLERNFIALLITVLNR